MNIRTIGGILKQWATAEPSVHLLALIGSRARTPEAIDAADEYSDWDFQIASSQPEVFRSGSWLQALGLIPRAYVLRTGRLGSSQKVSVVFDSGEVDLVVIPVEPFRELMKTAMSGNDDISRGSLNALTDLATVLSGGFRILKGEGEFGKFFDSVVRGIRPTRIDDAEVIRIAEAFVCDYVFTCRKVQRGEFVAAQRWLHLYLAEANFRLLHEVRLRGNKQSFPDARRVERLGEPLAKDVTINTRADGEELWSALDRVAAAHRTLVSALVRGLWKWPDFRDSRLRAK